MNKIKHGMLLLALLTSGCAGLQNVTALKGRHIELQGNADFMLRRAIERQARFLGASIGSSTEQPIDMQLSIDSQQCNQSVDQVSGSSARAASYQLRCTIRYSIQHQGEETKDSVSVRDSYLYDDVDSNAAQFPGRDNERQRLHKALNDAAASEILQQAALLLMGVTDEQ